MPGTWGKEFDSDTDWDEKVEETELIIGPLKNGHQDFRIVKGGKAFEKAEGPF